MLLAGQQEGRLACKNVQQLGLPSSRQHLSYDDLEVRRENNQNCSMLYCVQQLYTMIRTTYVNSS